MLLASIGCIMMMGRLLVYVYRAYTRTTVTVQAFIYVCASRRTVGRLTYVHLNTVSRHFGVETKKMLNEITDSDFVIVLVTPEDSAK